MKEYLGKEGFRQLVKLVRDALAKKADKAELAVQSNPNLLDNWYFGNPVNQRGQTEYASTATAYSIDRWTVTRAKASIGDSGIVLTSTSTNGSFSHPLSDGVRAAIKGQTVTLSVLLDIGLFSQTYQIPKSGNFDAPNPEIGVSKWYIDMFSVDNQDHVYFRIINTLAEDAPITVIAAKLELGDHQTLAHQDADGNWVLNDPPPDYGMELLKCQRYQFVIETSNNAYAIAGVGAGNNTERAVITIQIPVKMRANPSVSYSGKWALTAGFRVNDDIPVTRIEAVSVGNSNNVLDIFAYAEKDSITYCDFYALRASNDPTARIIFDANL